MNDEKPLSDKQEQFCLYYVGQAGFNGAKAARLAGAKPTAARVTAYQYLREQRVKSRIKFLLAAAGATEETVIAGLTEFATADPADFFDVNGQFSMRLARDNGVTRIIKKIEYHPDTFSRGGERIRGGVKSIEAVDAIKPLELLGRAHKLFVDRIEYDFTKLSDSELVEAAKGVTTGVAAPGADDQPGDGEGA